MQSRKNVTNSNNKFQILIWGDIIIEVFLNMLKKACKNRKKYNIRSKPKI